MPVSGNEWQISKHDVTRPSGSPTPGMANNEPLHWTLEDLGVGPAEFHDPADTGIKMFDESEDDTLIHIPKDGLYLINIHLRGDEDSASFDEWRFLRVHKNAPLASGKCDGEILAEDGAVSGPRDPRNPEEVREVVYLQLTLTQPLVAGDTIRFCALFIGGAIFRSYADFFFEGDGSWAEIIYLGPTPATTP